MSIKKNILKKIKNVNPKWYSRKIKNNSIWVLYLEKLYPARTLSEQLFLLINNFKTTPSCQICGGTIRLLKHKTCSGKCREMLKKTNGMLEEAEEKKRKTMLEKYGVDNPAKNKKIQEKRLNTMIKKYGGKTSLKTRELARERSEELNRKGRITIKKKYGVDNPSQIDGHRNKCEITLEKNYGVNHYFKSNEWKVKSFKNLLDRYSEMSTSCDILEIQLPDIELKKYHTNPNYRIKFKCNCGNIETIPTETFKYRINNFPAACSICSNIGRGSSAKEKEIVSFLKNIYNGIILENNRKIIYPYELDIVIPELKIAIEFNGLYWHKDGNCDKKYHINKTNKCREKEYRLIHIFEDEWDSHPDIVKKRLKYILGLEHCKIYARKCQIKEINVKEAREFIEKEHIQGYTGARIKIGLFYENELVSVMTFGKPNIAKGKHKNKNSWEIVRFCSSCNVVGGAGKLLAYFKKIYNPISMFTYADLRWNTGKLYKAIGFTYELTTTPGYWYFRDNNSKRYHRFSLRKNKDDNQDLTEWENRQIQGWSRIWDCGHAKYIWKNPGE